MSLDQTTAWQLAVSHFWKIKHALVVVLRRLDSGRTAEVNLMPGDRDAPIVVPADRVPDVCYWWTDPDGALCLLPGCLSRINDPEAECTCKSLASALAKAEARLEAAAEREQYANTWWTALRGAVDAHPDRNTILADARRRAGR